MIARYGFIILGFPLCSKTLAANILSAILEFIDTKVNCMRKFNISHFTEIIKIKCTYYQNKKPVLSD